MRNKTTTRKVRVGWAILSPLMAIGVLCGRTNGQVAAERPTSSPAIKLDMRVFKPPPFRQVRVSGELADRYNAATRNLLARTDGRYSLETFASSAAGKPGALWWDWPGDQIGRWFSVLSVAEGYGWPDVAQNRKAVADAALPHQSRDGNFGPPGSSQSDDIRIISGNGFALRGLMDAYADTHEPRYLDAARRMARYFEAVAPRWETAQNGMLHEFYGHCLDGLVALYEQGGDRWALDFARRLAAHAGRTPHTHHSLSLCRGLIDLSRVTGQREYLDKAKDYLAWCREHQTVTGGLPETMPKSEQDEGCGLADWIVVNLMMFEATGDDAFLETAEHTLVNHFFMNQFSTGGFGHRSFSQEIVSGKNWQGWDGRFGSENPGCCSLWGQWALGQVGRYIAVQVDGQAWVNLYASAQIQLPKPNIHLEISGDFPRMSKARIRITCEKPETFMLNLHRPPWARSLKIRCDGEPVDAQDRGTRISITRQWPTSSTVDIEFVSGVHLRPAPGGDRRSFGVFDGPLCLGLASDHADVNLPWAVLVDTRNQPVLDPQGRPQVSDPDGHILTTLTPVATSWLAQDVKDPARYRILFGTREAR